MSVERAFKGRRNEITRTLRKDGAVLEGDDLLAITKVQVRIGEVCLDTATSDADLISRDGAVITMRPGLSDAEPGKYTAKMTVFDESGAFAWGSFDLIIEPWPVCE